MFLTRSRYTCLQTCTRQFSFADMNLDHGLIKRLNSIGIRQPTEIQLKTLCELQDGKSAVVNSETGSGKTLAYALPIVQSLISLKQRNEIRKLPSPYALIITPTVELSYQVGNTFRNLTSRVCVANENSPLVVKDNDVIVTTSPYISTYPLNIFNEVQTVVIDEADILIAKKVGKHGRKDPLFNLIKHFLSNENFVEYNFLTRQFVFVGATMPDNESKKSKMALPYIKSWLPNITVFQAGNTHKITSLSAMQNIDVLEGNKEKLLIECIQGYYVNNKDVLPTYRVIVFVNKLETASSLYNHLTKISNKDSNAVREESHLENYSFDSLNRFKYDWHNKICLIHKNIPLEERLYTFEKFASSQNVLLITTDVSARGLDFPDVDLVIQYDFATNVIDVLHRAGRTARMGKQGKVINFVTATDETLARAIEHSIETEQPLDKLFSRHRSLRRKLKRQNERKEFLAYNESEA